ncbi:hypothetical protein KW429_11145 [Vibrio fluvialis]|nr:hypothetical protein [Vibrio fluvialis]
MNATTVFSSEDFFTNIEALTPKDWMYKLSSTFPSGGVTNMSRAMQLEVISQLPKEAQRDHIRTVVEDMKREQTEYLAQKHRAEIQREVETNYEVPHKPVAEIKAFI